MLSIANEVDMLIFRCIVCNTNYVFLTNNFYVVLAMVINKVIKIEILYSERVWRSDQRIDTRILKSYFSIKKIY